MSDFNPFDMDMDGDVDAIDFLGFHFMTQHLLEHQVQNAHPRQYRPVSKPPSHLIRWIILGCVLGIPVVLVWTILATLLVQTPIG